MPEQRIRPNGERIVILEEGDIEMFKVLMRRIALADNMGDVNETLPALARALALPEPTWNDRRGRMVFPWET